MIIDGLGIITVGDKNSSGGTVITGTNKHRIHGLDAACLHDLVDCPGKYPDGRPHGINKIMTSASRYIIHGLPAAVHGDRSECGCTLISKFYTGAGTMRTQGNDSSNKKKSPLINTFVDTIYDLRFQIRGTKSDEPLAHIPYKISLDNGKETAGITDASGFTQLVRSDSQRIAKIEAPYYGDSSTTQIDSCLGYDACHC